MLKEEACTRVCDERKRERYIISGERDKRQKREKGYIHSVTCIANFEKDKEMALLRPCVDDIEARETSREIA